MDAKTTNKIKDMICQKLEEIARNNALSNSDIEKLNMLIVAYEKLLKADEMEGISEARYQRNDGMMYDDRGSSYGMNRYSRGNESDMTREHLRRMMSSGNMSEADRRALERAMDII